MLQRVNGYNGSEECFIQAYPLVEIVNTGSTPLAMSDFSKYTLKDEEGREEWEFFYDTYPAILFPGETGYLTGDVFSNTWKKDAELEIVLDSNEVYTKHLFEADGFGITEVKVSKVNVSYDQSNEKIVVTGKVKNNSKREEAWIDIYVVLVDVNDIPVCVINTFVEDVPVGATVDFKMSQDTYGNISMEDITAYPVVAYAH